MPDIHIFAVRVPIALFTSGFAVSAAGYVLRRDMLKNAGFIMVILGSAGAVVAYLSGHVAETGARPFLSQGGIQALEEHKSCAEILIYCVFAAAGLGILLTASSISIRGSLRSALFVSYMTVGVLGFIIVLATAYSGERLVHEHGAGIRVLDVRLSAKREADIRSVSGVEFKRFPQRWSSSFLNQVCERIDRIIDRG